MRTRSIAPGAARWPQEICAPSKAGPVGEEQARRRSPVAEQNLGVGADVGDQRQFVAQIGRLGERDAGRVGADVAGDAWQRIDMGAWRDREAAGRGCVSYPLSIVSANGATPSSVGSRPRNK